MGVARLMASLGSRSGMRLRPIAASGGAARSSRSGTKGIRTASSCTDRERMYGAHSTRTSLSAHSPSSNGPEFACDSSQRRPLLRVALLHSAPSAQLRPQWHVEQAFFSDHVLFAGFGLPSHCDGMSWQSAYVRS